MICANIHAFMYIYVEIGNLGSNRFKWIFESIRKPRIGLDESIRSRAAIQQDIKLFNLSMRDMKVW